MVFACSTEVGIWVALGEGKRMPVDGSRVVEDLTFPCVTSHVVDREGHGTVERSKLGS